MKSLLAEFNGTRLDAAIVLAIQYHAGQLDKAGMPYILHPLRVMNAVKADGEEAMIAAVLHDAVEDTPLTLEEIQARFGYWIAVTVDSLTSCDGETYKEFIQRIAKDASSVAVNIKIADLRDNLSRLHSLPQEVADGLRKRYENALEVLGDVNE